MFALFGTILSAILSGGATGLLGIVIQRFFDMKSKTQDLELIRINNAQALALADKEVEKAKAQADAQVAVADRDLAARTEEARDALAGREAEAAADSMKASYGTDQARFLPAVLRSKSKFVLWSMAVVDSVRGLIRPVLTGYLVWEVHAMRRDLQDMLTAHGEHLPIASVHEYNLQIIGTTLYLATVAVVWWFGTRPPAGPRK